MKDRFNFWLDLDISKGVSGANTTEEDRYKHDL